MFVKKSGKKVFGANLTSAESKALDIEIKKRIAEFNKKNINEMDAVILWTLHDKFGFGKRRLRKFYDAFFVSIHELCSRYEMDENDQIWLCTQKLKDYGVDIQEWNHDILNGVKR